MENESEANLAELLTLRKVVTANNTIFYKNRNDQLHRIHGPAIIYPSGNTVWCYENKYHRENGPAFVRTNGSTEWYKHGKLHRIDGPAIEHKDGYKEWWIDGDVLRREGSTGSKPRAWYNLNCW